jgi:hypothetical protein
MSAGCDYWVVACRKGTHCPDTATSLKCPKGYHCPMQSVTPKKCRWLEDCSREGVANPMFSKGAFVNTVLVILGEAVTPEAGTGPHCRPA